MDPLRIFCRNDINVTPEYSRELIISNIIPFSFLGTPNLYNNTKSKRKLNFFEDKLDDNFYISDLSPFNHRSSYELASIDIFFNLTTHNSGSIATQILKSQIYALPYKDIGYINYLQYRNPLSFIYLFDSINLNEIKNSFIVYDRVKQIIDSNTTKDIDYYTNKILVTNYQGVDIYILNIYKTIDELLNFIIIMLKVLKSNGNAIIKLYSLENMMDIVQLMSYTFDHIFLFKSALSNIKNDEYILICKFYNKNKAFNIISFILDNLIGSLSNNLLIDVNIQTLNYINSIKQSVTKEIFNNSTYIPEKIKYYLNIQ